MTPNIRKLTNVFPRILSLPSLASDEPGVLFVQFYVGVAISV
jgi:hypothetical protein